MNRFKLINNSKNTLITMSITGLSQLKTDHVKNVILLVILALYHVNLNAATFCVTSNAEFQNALSIAENNGEDNLIKVRQGEFILTNELVFEANSDNDLEISGGWSFFFGNLCGIQSSKNPYLTVLNGNSLTRILRIIPTKFMDIKISYLTFTNGFIDANSQSGFYGAGIYIFSDNSSDITAYEGNVTILHNVFMFNEAVNSSAFHTTGNKIVFQNNLIYANHSINSGAISLVSRENSTGIYFINNTVVENTSQGTSTSLTGGLRLFSGELASGYIANNIFWDNDALDLHVSGNGFFYIYNNDIGTESYGNIARTELQNISQNPLFAPGMLNFKPQSNSPLVNAGRHPIPQPFPPLPFQHNWILSEIDLAENSRIEATIVDIGAYEYTDLIYINGFE